jgi:hypothetical protein
MNRYATGFQFHGTFRITGIRYRVKSNGIHAERLRDETPFANGIARISSSLYIRLDFPLVYCYYGLAFIYERHVQITHR